MSDSRLKATARKREGRLFAARSSGGVYVDVFVYVYETTYGKDEWFETGRAYRLRDGTQVYAEGGKLMLASTGELLTRV